MAEEQAPVFFKSLDDLKNSLENGQDKDQRILDLSKKSMPAFKNEEEWFTEDYEGQLAVDVYQTKDKIIVRSTIAGVKPEDLEIYIHHDLLTIRGKREQEREEKEADFFYKECYWGGFSRSIILPVDVQVDKVEAVFKNGILTITMPKAAKSKLINVKVTPE